MWIFLQPVVVSLHLGACQGAWRIQHQSIPISFDLFQDWGNSAHRAVWSRSYTLELMLSSFGILLISFPRSYPSAFLDYRRLALGALLLYFGLATSVAFA